MKKTHLQKPDLKPLPNLLAKAMPRAFNEALEESTLTLISPSTLIKGEFTVSGTCRIHGVIEGTLKGTKGSFIVVSENAKIVGDIFADDILIDGYVKGDVVADGKLSVSGTGRVQGNLKASRITIDFGAFFEGTAAMPGASDVAEKLQ